MKLHDEFTIQQADDLDKCDFFHSFRWAHWCKVCNIATHMQRVKEYYSYIYISTRCQNKKYSNEVV